MLSRCFIGGILGPYNFFRRSGRWPEQNQFGPWLADSNIHLGGPWVFWLSRLLPQVHQRVWGNCSSSQQIAVQRRVSLDIGNCNCILTIKGRLDVPPVLLLTDFSQPFVIESDACGVGIGAILSQGDQPIAYFSEVLKPSVLAWSTYEKEMLAIVKAINKWCPYLLGKPFIVRTDQKNLKYLLKQRITTPAQTRWLSKILGYDYVIEYKKGTENGGANALSRLGEAQFLAISLPVVDWWTTL